MQDRKQKLEHYQDKDMEIRIWMEEQDVSEQESCRKIIGWSRGFKHAPLSDIGWNHGWTGGHLSTNRVNWTAPGARNEDPQNIT